MDVQVEMQTEDGALDEVLTAELRASAPDSASSRRGRQQTPTCSEGPAVELLDLFAGCHAFGERQVMRVENRR
jgi:hypothetical protein